jgi:hypothetical protein
LSIDGGVFVAGAVDKLSDATGLVGVANPDDLVDRISQVAAGTISPPLNVVIHAVRDEQDPEGLACLIVEVPASAGAPHMVDEKYWGRHANGKRALTDNEVRRLFDERISRAADFTHQLLEMERTFDPVDEHTRKFGHIHLFARPVMTPRVNVTEVLASQPVTGWIQEFLPGQPAFSPGFTMLKSSISHADGLMVTSLRDSDPPQRRESFLVQLLLDDQGGTKVTSGAGTSSDTEGSELYIVPNYHLEVAHQMVSVSAAVLNEYAAYRGLWDIGVHATKLKGLKSTFALARGNYRYPTTPFQTENYTCTTSTNTDEMLATPQNVVERLYRRFTRGLGLDSTLFPYDAFSEIGEKTPRDW